MSGNELRLSLSNKENVGNKVTSWSSTPTDTHYPSEKLTKEYIDKPKPYKNVQKLEKTLDLSKAYYETNTDSNDNVLKYYDSLFGPWEVQVTISTALSDKEGFGFSGPEGNAFIFMNDEYLAVRDWDDYVGDMEDYATENITFIFYYDEEEDQVRFDYVYNGERNRGGAFYNSSNFTNPQFLTMNNPDITVTLKTEYATYALYDSSTKIEEGNGGNEGLYIITHQSIDDDIIEYNISFNQNNDMCIFPTDPISSNPPYILRYNNNNIYVYDYLNDDNIELLKTDNDLKVIGIVQNEQIYYIIEDWWVRSIPCDEINYFNVQLANTDSDWENEDYVTPTSTVEVTIQHSIIEGVSTDEFLKKTDVVNSLYDADSTLPLAAAQGYTLKTLIDAKLDKTTIDDNSKDYLRDCMSVVSGGYFDSNLNGANAVDLRGNSPSVFRLDLIKLISYLKNLTTTDSSIFQINATSTSVAFSITNSDYTEGVELPYGRGRFYVKLVDNVPVVTIKNTNTNETIFSTSTGSAPNYIYIKMQQTGGSSPYVRLAGLQNFVTINSIANIIYPVGSIYMSVNSTSPATLFGGVWEQLKDKFLLSAGDTYSNGATGGSATVTLTENEIPTHNHNSKTLTGTARIQQYSGSASSTTGIISQQNNNYNLGQANGSNFGSTTITVNATHTHDDIGGGQAHNNMPPYLAVYMWKRVA